MFYVGDDDYSTISGVMKNMVNNNEEKKLGANHECNKYVITHGALAHSSVVFFHRRNCSKYRYYALTKSLPPTN